VSFSRVISIERVPEVFQVKVEFRKRPEPGQFVSLITPGPREVPLSVGDWEDGTLTLFIESERLAKSLGKYVYVKGPLGTPLELKGKKLIAIAYGNRIYDLNYVIKSAERKGMDVYVKCYECSSKYPEPEDLNADVVVASVPKEMLGLLPKGSLVYVRWVRMNCMVGVCGKCEINGRLACVEGPFLRWEDVVQG